MKGNDGTGNNSERNEWQTPQALWDKLNKQYRFNFDCCALKENTKCNDYSSNFKQFMDIELQKKICWMNPPFSKSLEMFKHFFKVVKKGICIYRCDNLETKLWQDIILSNASWILIPKGRIRYESMEGKGSRFPSALIGFNLPIPKFIKGKILIIKWN